MSTVTGMHSVMEQIKTVDLSKAAFLRARGIDRHPHNNQSVLLHFWRNIVGFASRLFHSLLNHLIVTGCSRLVVIKGFGAREPAIPLTLVRPGHFQGETEKESQGPIDYPNRHSLARGLLPMSINLSVSVSAASNRMLNIMANQENSYYMRYLPGSGLCGDAKNRKSLGLLPPKNCYSWVRYLHFTFHRQMISVRCSIRKRTLIVLLAT